jgi:hypothetical protein
MNRLPYLLFVLLMPALLLAQDVPKSPAARSAIAKYEIEVKKIDEEAARQKQRAAKDLVDALKKAQADVLKAGNLAEGNAIQGEIDRAEKSAEIASGVFKGRVYLVVKGNAVLSVGDGRPLISGEVNKSVEATTANVTLRRGEQLTLRVSSSFRFRSFRVAVVSADGEQLPLQWVREGGDVGTGRFDDRMSAMWSATPAAQFGEWIAIPDGESNQWFTFTARVP